jgi:hypothetical protein
MLPPARSPTIFESAAIRSVDCGSASRSVCVGLGLALFGCLAGADGRAFPPRTVTVMTSIRATRLTRHVAITARAAPWGQCGVWGEEWVMALDADAGSTEAEDYEYDLAHEATGDTHAGSPAPAPRKPLRPGAPVADVGGDYGYDAARRAW